MSVDLYSGTVVPLNVIFSSAAITLHNPYLNFSDPRSVSTSRCVSATRAILAAYYRLSETSLDITRLHPFVTVSIEISAALSTSDSRFAF